MRSGSKPTTSPKQKHGPTSKYNPRNIRSLLKHVSSGMTRRDAALMIGVTDDTVLVWRKLHPELSDKIELANLKYKQSLIRKVSKAPTWKAAAWILERRYAEDFATISKHELSGPGGEPVAFEEVKGKLLARISNIVASRKTGKADTGA